MSNKCSHTVLLWERKLPIPSLSTTWPAVPFSKAFWGSIFSWRTGRKDNQPLFSGSLHLALGDAGDAKQCEVDGGWQGRYVRSGFF